MLFSISGLILTRVCRGEGSAKKSTSLPLKICKNSGITSDFVSAHTLEPNSTENMHLAVLLFNSNCDRNYASFTESKC